MSSGWILVELQFKYKKIIPLILSYILINWVYYGNYDVFIKSYFCYISVCLAMKNLTVNLIESSCSFEELKKPASNLMALRQFYIHNNDFKSYNDWMYLVKDSILLFGKEKMWSQFIDSKFVNKKIIIVNNENLVT